MRLAFGEHQLDTEARILERGGQAVSIQDKTFDLLVYLIEHREHFVSHDELLDALWPGVNVSQAAISAAVQKARQAVGDDGERQAVVRTKHGQGFRFVADVSVVSTPESTTPAPDRSRSPWTAAAGVAALLLVATCVWLLNRPVGDLALVRSIAVLPLENLSGDPEQEYFADGMTDELISTLAKIDALRVISRTSAMHYKGAREPLPKIARDLNVGAIVEGSVLRVGDRVRITAQLVDGANDRHLWAEQYERDLRDVLLLQSEIAQAIAREIRVVLTPEEEEQLASAPVVDPEAYEWRQKGAYYLDKNEFESGAEAYKKAIEIDPDSAVAHASLSASYSLRADWGFEDASMMLPEAYAAVTKALELDPSLAVAHNSMGLIRIVERNWPEAIRSFNRASELNASFPHGHNNLAAILSQMGRHDEAITQVTRAQQLDPLDDVINANAVGFDRLV
jgi:TolB-like protein/Flp pilus assembly protein TadD